MDTFEARIGTLSPMLRGLVVSLLLLSGTPTSLIAGALADKYGHLAIVLAGAILFTAGALLETASVDLAMLLVGRILLGAGEGLYLGNINVYICEIAPKARRGMLVAMPQLLVTAGLCAGYFTCYGTIRLSNEWQWRIPFLVQVIGGAAFAIATYLLPSSPRWLLQKAQPEKARESLQQLGLTDDELSLELRPNELQEREQSTTPRAGDGAGTLSSNVMLELFSKEYRFRTILALFILGMVQLCGIDGVLYVCSSIPKPQNHRVTYHYPRPVRPDPVRPSRSRQRHRLLRRLRRLRPVDVRHLDPRLPDRGRLRPPQHRRCWRRPAVRVYARDRRDLLDLRAGRRGHRGAPLGHHRADFPFCVDLRRDVGDCRQDLCVGDPAGADARDGELAGTGAEFRKYCSCPDLVTA